MTAILLAFAIVGGLGLICALLLVVASHFFRIEEEELTKDIRECLPGANCGACGYTGCDGYAKALALGECEPDLCVPGGKDTAAKLSEVLGLEIKVAEPLVAFVACNGNLESATKKADYDGIASCKAASMIYAGPNSCRFGCVGCGDCANVCPTNAICIENGIAHVDPRACIGCGMCVRECPKNIIKLLPVTAKVAVMCSSKDKGAVARKACKNACIGCKQCERACESGAIKVVDNLSVIDYSKCTACGKCAQVCPTKCIRVTDLVTK